MNDSSCQNPMYVSFLSYAHRKTLWHCAAEVINSLMICLIPLSVSSWDVGGT